MCFSDFLESTGLSAKTKYDYKGQYKQIIKILKTDDLEQLIETNLPLVLMALKSNYNDPKIKMGIASYKKKLEVIKWINRFLVKQLNLEAYNYINHLKIEHTTDFNDYVSSLKKQCRNATKLQKNFQIIDNDIDFAWNVVNSITSNPQATPEQQQKQFHDLDELKQKWLIQFNKICDEIEEIQQSQEEMGDTTALKLLMKKYVVNGEDKYKRKTQLIEWEACCCYGLYLHAPPRRCKDYQNMRVALHKDFTNEEDNWYVATPNDTSRIIIQSYKTDKVYGRYKIKQDSVVEDFHNELFWTCLKTLNDIRVLINYPNPTKKLFIETNLGNRLKTWSKKYLFNNDKTKATNINDLRHIFVNNFYKIQRSTEERENLAKHMAHSVKTQAYYKKDNVN